MFAITTVIVTVAYTPDYFEISKQLDIFTNVFREVNLYYVDETEPGELMDEAIVSMLSSLDPYTNYIPEERVEDYKIQTTGNYGGIGAGIRLKNNQLIVTNPYEGFSADKAGMMAGDIIKEVDGKSVVGKSTADVSKVLKGAPETEVEILYERQGKDFTIKLKREEVQVKSVPYYGMVENGIGYIALDNFTNQATKEVKAAFKDLKSNNDLKGIILDLRGNPGGLLHEAVNITNLFIGKGLEVVKTKGKIAEWKKTYKTLNRPEDLEIPISVLISRGSASASEIVSGTLQDYDRAVILGKRSFGKGLVQQTRELSYGSQIKVTIAKYYTPSGRCIQAINYAERGEDGTVAKLPDSLRTRFETENGRAVYDGGGIDPDIEVEREILNEAIVALYNKMLIFNFATNYRFSHDSIDAAADFNLSDEEYGEFKKWIASQEFNYETRTEKNIKSLEKTAIKENYWEAIATEVDDIKLKVAKEKIEFLDVFEEEIRRLLEEEIVARYYYSRGRLENSMTKDKDVLKAIEVMSDLEQYQSILSGNS